MQNEDFLANLISNPAIIGLLSSLITAVITSVINSYTNKRMFRDEIANQQLTIKFWDDYKTIISEIYLIDYKIISYICTFSRIISNNQKNTQKSIKEIESILNNDLIPCLQDLIKIKSKLVLICPKDVILAFEKYEHAAFSIKTDPSPGEEYENYISIYNDLGNSFENLIKAFQNTMSKIISHNLKFSDILINQTDVTFRPIEYRDPIK